MRNSELRTAVQRRLGSRFRQGLWDYLVDRGFVDEVLDGASDLDQLLDEARRIQAAGTPSAEHRVPAPAPREPRLGQERAWALSQLVAAHAHQDPDVIAFRHKYLGDALVEWADLDTWITAQAKPPIGFLGCARMRARPAGPADRPSSTISPGVGRRRRPIDGL
jgi:hypothetical protein